MPTRIEKLMRQARQAAHWRKHKLAPFEVSKLESGRDVAHATCKRCGCGVQVLPNPQPNEIDIGGTAVSINCSGKEGS